MTRLDQVKTRNDKTAYAANMYDLEDLSIRYGENGVSNTAIGPILLRTALAAICQSQRLMVFKGSKGHLLVDRFCDFTCRSPCQSGKSRASLLEEALLSKLEASELASWCLP